MAATDEDLAPEVLTEAECRWLLTRTHIGRLAFTDGALPVVLPVSFALHRDSIIIPARTDSPVISAVRGAVVAFQVDSCGLAGSGDWWSVTVVGPSRVVSDPAEVRAHDRLGLFARRPAVDHRYITVRVGLLRGWRGGSPVDDSPCPAARRSVK